MKLGWAWIRWFLMSAFLLGFLAGCGDSDDQQPLSESERQAVEETTDSLVDELDVPGVLVAVQRKGEDVFTYASGVADSSSGRALDVDDHIRVGSISKSYAAMTVLVLVKEGMLTLDDTLDQWIPGVLDATKYDESAITIRHLLNHTSGVNSFTYDEQYFTELLADPEQIWTVDELIDIVNDRLDPAATVGEWAYSNTNTVLASLIIEKVTGQAYRDVLQEKVLTPLELTNTSFPENGDHSLPEPYSLGYVNPLSMYGLGDDELLELTEVDPSAFWSSGAVISTIGDLARWMRAISQCELLDEATCEEQFTYVSVEEGAAHFGLGVVKEDSSIPGYVGHRGQIFGFDCSMQYQEEEETVVVGCANQSLPSGANSIILALEEDIFSSDSRAANRTATTGKQGGFLSEY